MDFARLQLPQMSPADRAATLTAFTAASIAKIVELLLRRPASGIVAGGGANNPTLMRMLVERVAPAGIETAASAGWQGDAIEAQAFAFSPRSLKGLPLTFPGTTGDVAAPLTGGVSVRCKTLSACAPSVLDRQAHLSASQQSC